MAPTGSFQRSVIAGSFQVTDVPKPGSDIFPPATVRDLKATVISEVLDITFTAPGDDLNDGTAATYDIFVADNNTLISNKTALEVICHQVNQTDCIQLMEDYLMDNTTLTPVPGGEPVLIRPNMSMFDRETQYFLILKVTDDAGHWSWSNMATFLQYYDSSAGHTAIPASLIMVAYVVIHFLS